MREKHTKPKIKSENAVRSLPMPDYITCPRCGFEVELWTARDETRCLFCGRKFFRGESTIH